VSVIHFGRCLSLIAAVGVGGCTMPAFLSQAPQVRGNKLDADAIKQLVPGTSTRADVTSLLGSPTTKATFDDNQWIYASQVTRPVIAGTQTVLHQSVWLLTFNQAGVLQSLQDRTLADSEPVDVVSRTTPTPGSETSFLGELLGNVGKIAPTGLESSGGGSPNGGSNGNGSGNHFGF
jgi:outer membrane protein assembly factor BamE (lipoprotein component of BamABCDE complex)